jgi:hypothetical protein
MLQKLLMRSQDTTLLTAGEKMLPHVAGLVNPGVSYLCVLMLAPMVEASEWREADDAAARGALARVAAGCALLHANKVRTHGVLQRRAAHARRSAAPRCNGAARHLYLESMGEAAQRAMICIAVSA